MNIREIFLFNVSITLIIDFFFTENWYFSPTPGPHLMRIHLVRYSTSARYEKYSIIHLVRPIIHLVQIFALSTS